LAQEAALVNYRTLAATHATLVKLLDSANDSLIAARQQLSKLHGQVGPAVDEAKETVKKCEQEANAAEQKVAAAEQKVAAAEQKAAAAKQEAAAAAEQEAAATAVAELEAAVARHEAELGKLTPGSDAHAKVQQQLGKDQDRLQAARESLRSLSGRNGYVLAHLL